MWSATRAARRRRAAWLGLACALAVAALVSGPGARADDAAPATVRARDAYALELRALIGPPRAELRLALTPAQGLPAVETIKKVKLKIFAPDGSKEHARNLNDLAAPGGVATVALEPLERGQRIVVDALVQPDAERTYPVRAETTAKLRPDLVVEQIQPLQALAGRPVVVQATVAERNGDVGATAVVSLSAVPGATQPVVVPAGGRATVAFAPLTFGSAVPVALAAEVGGADPVEADTANNARTSTLDLTEHQLPQPRFVLFPSLLGYGAQFNNHVYAPITPWPEGQGYGNFEEKVRTLEPHLVRIFYNDNWDGNANGLFPDWQTNYASFVEVVKLAQSVGATIDISFQNLANARLPQNQQPSMVKFADVLQDLVRNHGITSLRWAEVGNEPNSPGGLVTLEEYNALVRVLHAELVARGLDGQIQIMAGGLVESSGARNHYAWLQWIADNMGDVVDGYAEHVYWWYDASGRLEYRLRDIAHLANEVLPADRRRPMYMMEFGIRGYNTCTGKPTMPTGLHLYYRDESCTDIWRTNIAAFQQLWFNVHSAQLGVAGAVKWDAYWGRYDRSSANNQVHWTIGPPTEGSPLTPSYNALSLLFHTTVPGWQILRVEPWDADDSAVPAYGVTGGGTSSDTPEQELVAYAGPAGELTVVGLDTNGRNLNTPSTAAPAAYSIGGLPASTTFRLAVWNLTGDGTNSIAGTVATNAAGVARFELPQHAAFALTTVPVA
jgi:hypothetical protein